MEDFDLTMTSRIPIVLGLLLALAGVDPGDAQKADAQKTGVQEVGTLTTPKRAGASARLLVPFFEVDLTSGAGATTFFSVRNEISQSVDIQISLFAPDSPQSPFHTEVLTLAPKQIRTVDVRSRPNLIADGDGIARGYVVIETVKEEAVIQGDYFQITPNEAFANGSRLVNIDSNSADNDLCSVFTIRFLNGGGFSGGTEFTLWLDLDVAPQDAKVLSYVVYSESGELIFFTDLTMNQVSLRTTANDLTSLIPTNFGAIEFQFNDGVRGHISAVMKALGLYSVGLEASCSD